MMHSMREIVETELKATNALGHIYSKMPSEFWDELVDLVIQKMDWAYSRGRDDEGLENAQDAAGASL